MAFAKDSDVVILNDAGEFSPKLAERRGRGRSKSRRTIEIVSEPLLHDFDANMLGVKPSEAIKNAISAGIKAVSAVASAATLRRRERAKRRLSGAPSPRQESFRRRGAPYDGSYEQRYAGGRIGLKMPGQTVRLFNDSGRLADGLAVRQNPTDATFTVNVPANRLDPSEFNPTGLFNRMIDKLRQYVPILSDARKLLEDPKVREAINESIRDMILKGDSRDQKKLEAAAAARKRAIMAILRAIREAAV